MPATDLEAALRAAVAAQLMVVDAEGGYQFRHALVREAVHDDLLPGELARLHARYAAAIEADPHLVAAGRAPAELAHHWYAAHDNPRALTAARIAADAAHGRYAYAEQARLLERVLELWEQVDDAQEVLGIDHLALIEETLAAAYSAGDYHRALSLTRVGLDEVDEDAEPSRAARLLERRGKLLGHVGESDGLAELRRAYELAVRQTDDPGRAGLLADVAYHISRLDPVEGAKLAEEARRVADEVGDREAEMSAALTLGRVCSTDLAAEDGLPQLRRVAAVARERNDLLSLVMAQVNISDALFEMGEYAESAQVAEAGAALALKIGVSRSTGAYLRRTSPRPWLRSADGTTPTGCASRRRGSTRPGSWGCTGWRSGRRCGWRAATPGRTIWSTGHWATSRGRTPTRRFACRCTPCGSTRRWPSASPTVAWPRRSPDWPTRTWMPTRGTPGRSSSPRRG